MVDSTSASLIENNELSLIKLAEVLTKKLASAFKLSNMLTNFFIIAILYWCSDGSVVGFLKTAIGFIIPFQVPRIHLMFENFLNKINKL